MNPDTGYPFSDLTADQFESLMRAARYERAKAIRSLFAALFSGRREKPAWPPRQRETQVWPPKNLPALSLTAHL